MPSMQNSCSEDNVPIFEVEFAFITTSLRKIHGIHLPVQFITLDRRESVWDIVLEVIVEDLLCESVDQFVPLDAVRSEGAVDIDHNVVVRVGVTCQIGFGFTGDFAAFGECEAAFTGECRCIATGMDIREGETRTGKQCEGAYSARFDGMHVEYSDKSEGCDRIRVIRLFLCLIAADSDN